MSNEYPIEITPNNDTEFELRPYGSTVDSEDKQPEFAPDSPSFVSSKIRVLLLAAVFSVGGYGVKTQAQNIIDMVKSVLPEKPEVLPGTPGLPEAPALLQESPAKPKLPSKEVAKPKYDETPQTAKPDRVLLDESTVLEKAAFANTKFRKIIRYIESLDIPQRSAHDFFKDAGFRNRVRALIMSDLSTQEQKQLYFILAQKHIIPKLTSERISDMQDVIKRANLFVTFQHEADSELEVDRANRHKRRVLILCLRAVTDNLPAMEIAEILNKSQQFDIRLVKSNDDYSAILDFVSTKLAAYGISVDVATISKFNDNSERSNFYQEIEAKYLKFKKLIPSSITLEMLSAIGTHELGPRMETYLEGNDELFAKMSLTYLAPLSPLKAFRPVKGAFRFGPTQRDDQTLNWAEFDRKIVSQLTQIGAKTGITVDGYDSAFALAIVNQDAAFLLGVACLMADFKYTQGQSDNIIMSNRIGGPASRTSSDNHPYLTEVNEVIGALKSRWKTVFKKPTR